MTAQLLTGALYGLGAWCVASAVLVLAYGLVRASSQARANAAIRATRRQMRAELLEETTLVEQEFARIVARLRADA